MIVEQNAKIKFAGVKFELSIIYEWCSYNIYVLFDVVDRFAFTLEKGTANHSV